MTGRVSPLLIVMLREGAVPACTVRIVRQRPVVVEGGGMGPGCVLTLPKWLAASVDERWPAQRAPAWDHRPLSCPGPLGIGRVQIRFRLLSVRRRGDRATPGRLPRGYELP